MAATFHFYMRDNRPNKLGLCPIYLRITFNRKKKYLNTGIKVAESEWNEDKQQVRRNHRTYQKLNEELDIIRANAEQAYRDLNRERKVSADSIKKRLEYSSKDDFYILAKDYLKDIKPDSFYTWKQSKVAIEKIREFHKSDSLPVNHIDIDFLNNFVTFLKREKENKPATIHKNFTAISNILDMASHRHLIPNNPVHSEEFQLPKRTKPKLKAKLSSNQIEILEKMELPENSNLWHARNVFMMSYYFCGMRFGDLSMLKWKNVKGGRLKYEMGKTGHEINIKRPEKAEKYLKMYDADGRKSHEFILPFLRDLNKEERKSPELLRKRVGSWNAVLNGQDKKHKLTGLKKLGKLAKLDEVLSMHVARHSFAQYAIEEKNIPVYRLMVLLGHQNIKTTMNYLKTINVTVADQTIEEIF